MIYTNKKKHLILLDKIIVIFLWPIYLLRVRFLNRLYARARAAVIKKYIVHLGGEVGENFRIGRNVELRIAPGAKISLGDNVYLGDNVMINCRISGSLTIGDCVHIQSGGRVSAFNKISIGKGTLIASYSNILDHDHLFDLKSSPSTSKYSSSPILIGAGVWLGTKVQVNKGVTIGDFSVVGANAVVTKDLSGGAVYVGVPARATSS